LNIHLSSYHWTVLNSVLPTESCSLGTILNSRWTLFWTLRRDTNCKIIKISR
jgi:hypothetical protein